MSAKTQRLGPFLGLNNRLPAHALTVTDKGSFLANAVNVDCDDSGRLARRSGYAALTACHTGRSLFSDGRQTLYADDGVLYRLQPASGLRTPLTPVDASAPIAYASAHDDIYWSDGQRLGRIDGAGQAQPLGVPTPPAPVVSLTTGRLPAGVYQVGVTLVGETGEEGALSPLTRCTVPEAGGLEVLLPAVPPHVREIQVYLSAQHGGLLNLALSVEPGIAPRVTLGDLARGRACLTQNLAAMPPGQVLASLNGRLLVATQNLLFFSEPWNFGLYNPVSGYVPFPTPIAVLAPCVNGVYVATEGGTYWLTGIGTPEFDLLPVLPYGAVAGAMTPLPGQERVAWLSPQGVILADSQGQVVAPQEATVAMETASRGALLYREAGGEQLIGTLTAPVTPARQAHPDYRTSEARRDKMV